MENIKWIFDGFGTEILSLIIGLATGGAIGYKVGYDDLTGTVMLDK